jgi:hypothetical protein
MAKRQGVSMSVFQKAKLNAILLACLLTLPTLPARAWAQAPLVPFASQSMGGAVSQAYLVQPGESGEVRRDDKGIDKDAKEEKEKETEKEKEKGEEKEEEKEPSDLTLSNLFAVGWSEKFAERPKAGRAARIHLFQTRRPFFDEEFRLNYRFEHNGDGGALDEHELEPEIEFPLNRRLLFEVEGEYTWQNFRREPERNGGTLGLSAWLQLVDTADSALNVQFRVDAPNRGLDESRTRLGLVLAGFRDLGHRVGLQAHVENDFIVGGTKAGDPHNELTYAVALTKTLTDDTPCLGYFTPFVETYGVTQLDGGRAGSTAFSFLPGVRWEFKKDWWFAAGVEVPVTGPRPFDETVHIAIIREQ